MAAEIKQGDHKFYVGVMTKITQKLLLHLKRLITMK